MSELMKDSLETYKNKIRNRVWYWRFMELAILLEKEKCKNPVKVLKEFDALINRIRGYHYKHVAISAYESLEQVCLDMGWKLND